MLLSWFNLYMSPSPDLALGSWVTGASCRMLHPNGRSAESHPGSDADHEAAQRQPRGLPEAEHAALQPRRAPRVTQVSWNNQTRFDFSQQSHANEADFHIESESVSKRWFYLRVCLTLRSIYWSVSVQSHPRVSEAGPGWQRVFQPLQASEKAQQAAGRGRRANSNGEVGGIGALFPPKSWSS